MEWALKWLQIVERAYRCKPMIYMSENVANRYNWSAVAKGNYNLWRLMIDKAYQGRGYGKEAVRLALEFIKSFPCGAAEYCWLSYEPENESAQNLYSSFGFAETGDMDGEELIAVLKL